MTAPAAPVDAVREQYESLPYPHRHPEDERQRLLHTLLGQIALVNQIAWGGQRRIGPGFRVLDAGCGTGDSVVFMAEQLRGSGAEVVAVDLSEASLGVARARAEVRGLEDITFVRSPIEELPTLGLGTFDYVLSSGVLHHMASPEVGLRTLRQMLKPDGMAGVMVYAPYGRAHIYQLQELFRLIAPATMPTNKRVAIARETLAQLRATHWGSLGRETWQTEVTEHGDSGLFDLFLHSRDRAYSVSQLREWVDGAGLRFLRFDTPRIYEPELYRPDGNFSGMTEVERQAAAELLHGRMSVHHFFATQPGHEPPPAPNAGDLSAIPTWLQFEMHEVMREKLDRGQELRLSYNGLELVRPLDPVTRSLLKRIDGEISVGGLLEETRARYGGKKPAEIQARWEDAYRALAGFNALGLRAA